jgi:thiol-disulfide isomerase/thioredoxin
MKIVQLGILSLLAVSGMQAQAIDGLWDATLKQGTTEIPFKLGFSGTGSEVKGWFFNGEDKLISSGGTYENGSLVLNFDSYLGVLKLTLKDGALDGDWSTSRGGRAGAGTPVHAVRDTPQSAPKTPAPKVAGVWVIEDVKSSKGEKAWNLVVTQKGNDVTASILRVDGDTGALTGGWRDGKFVVSHFDGSRPALWTITPLENGTLSVDQGSGRGGGTVIAIKPEEVKAKGLAEPTDANAFTTVKDPTQPFPFSFPDLDGKIVSSTDARFQGKVVLINITGSWCPNCHDEAPFLAEVYNKYHSKGLEIVALSFEEADQVANPTRLRAFIKQNDIKYTVLLGGETNSAKEKLTQAQNWNAWPTTFFVGRDGLVKGAHAGFPSSGSGILYEKEKKEFVERVEKLLAENAQTAKK